MALLLVLRMLAWITVTTLALTTVVTTVSLMMSGLIQTLSQSAMAMHSKAYAHTFMVMLMGLLHSATLLPAV
ncbi:MAG: hypothetical protein WAK61_20310 [Leclercia sp.]